jgi:hypothetical protein
MPIFICLFPVVPVTADVLSSSARRTRRHIAGSHATSGEVLFRMIQIKFFQDLRHMCTQRIPIRRNLTWINVFGARRALHSSLLFAPSFRWMNERIAS